MRIFENGIELASINHGAIALTDPGTLAYQNTSIGGYGRGDDFYFQAPIDDVAVYDRALTVPEITDMYNSGICANPERLNGTIVYNADQNVMQYCDALLPGNGWQATGP